MQATPAQIARTASDWSALAGEPVGIEQIRATLYAYCPSELGALRLKDRMGSGRHGYSTNLSTWYYAKEIAA